MNITIDTHLKTITINGQINGKEFIDEIKKLGIDLKEYSFVTKVESYPYYPYINAPLQFEYPNYQTPQYIFSDNSGTYTPYPRNY